MNFTAPLIPQDILLNIRVRALINGSYGNFGPACRLRIPSTVCATTQLTTTPSPITSCGATGLTQSSLIYAQNVPGATGYQFEFSRIGYLRRILSPTRWQGLNFVTVPLQMNFCYQVRVRVSFDNSMTYCPFGAYCNITMGIGTCGEAMAPAPENATDHSELSTLTIWPNPNDGSQVTVSVNTIDELVTTASVQIIDISGKVVHSSLVPIAEGRLRSQLLLERSLAPGLYMVSVLIGDHTLNERLVVQ